MALTTFKLARDGLTIEDLSSTPAAPLLRGGRSEKSGAKDELN